MLPTVLADELPLISNILVAYFSATGNTEAVAKHIANSLNATLFEIASEIPYTTEDLNWRDNTSRSQIEQNDGTARPAFTGTVENMDSYEIIFLGYPIWNGTIPRIIYTFLESYDFTGKTIMPFSTSGSSGNSQSIVAIQNILSDSNIGESLNITRENLNRSNEMVSEWLSGLDVGVGSTTNSVSSTQEGESMTRITITVGDSVITATMHDNPTARDFVSLLPLTLDMRDFNNIEKIADLPRALSTENAPIGYQPSAGAITLFAPWGNLAIFYDDFRFANGLIPLGNIETGVEILANMREDFTAVIEIAD